MIRHSLLQGTTFCQNSSLWPVHLRWPYMGWLIVLLRWTRLWFKWSVWFVFCNCDFHSQSSCFVPKVHHCVICHKRIHKADHVVLAHSLLLGRNLVRDEVETFISLQSQCWWSCHWAASQAVTLGWIYQCLFPQESLGQVVSTADSRAQGPWI